MMESAVFGIDVMEVVSRRGVDSRSECSTHRRIGATVRRRGVAWLVGSFREVDNRTGRGGRKAMWLG